MPDSTPTPAHGGSGRWWPIALAAGVYALLAAKFRWLCDDSFIAFRYARHLAEGHGLRFNLAENPPIEGYTQFLWVAWCALAEALRLDVTVVAPATTFACGVVLVGWIAALARRALGLDDLRTALVGLFAATLPPMAVWATGGLETMAFTLLGFWLFASLLGNDHAPGGKPFQAVAAAMLLAWMRADAAVLAGAVLAGALAVAIAARRTALARAVVVAGIAFALASAAHVAWRFAYHGDLVPNTAHVKAGFAWIRLERGVFYVISQLLHVPGLLLALALAATGMARAAPRFTVRAAVVVAAIVLYAIYVGGDFMAYGRFLVPALPFAALLLAVCLKSAGAGTASALLLAGPLIVLNVLPCFAIDPVPESARAQFKFRLGAPRFKGEYERWEGMKSKAEDWSELGRALRRYTRPGESIIRTSIGAVGYYTDLHIFDMYGLVDREVALRDDDPEPATPGHDRAVPRGWFLKNDPTYVFADLIPGGDEALAAHTLAMVKEQLGGIPLDMQLVPLSPEQGFRGDAALMLVRRRVEGS